LSAALAAARRWREVVCAAIAGFIGLALLAPLLMLGGQAEAARSIYAAYRLTCHQAPERSYFVGGARLTYARDELPGQAGGDGLAGYLGGPGVGYKTAFCQRDLATYSVILLVALLWPRLGRRLPRLPLRAFIALLLPLAVDGLTQAAGWRESTWLLRSLTGGLFGLAIAWLLLPELEAAAAAAVRSLSARLSSPER